MLFIFCLKKEDFMHKILPQEKPNALILKLVKIIQCYINFNSKIAKSQIMY